MSHPNKKGEALLNDVLLALQTLSSQDIYHNTPPLQEEWPKTRDIAESCGITIYLARYYLIKLTKMGKAYATPRSGNKSLRWYIADSVQLPEEKKKENRFLPASEM